MKQITTCNTYHPSRTMIWTMTMYLLLNPPSILSLTHPQQFVLNLLIRLHNISMPSISIFKRLNQITVLITILHNPANLNNFVLIWMLGQWRVLLIILISYRISNHYMDQLLLCGLQMIHLIILPVSDISQFPFLSHLVLPQFAWTFYTPSLPATILSPMSIASDLKCLGYSSFANLDGKNCCLTIHGHDGNKITFPLQLQHGLLFTQQLHRPKPLLSSPNCLCPVSPIPPIACTLSGFPIQHLSKLQLSHLWHQRFGHLN